MIKRSKTYAYYIEKFGGLALGLIVSCAIMYINPHKEVYLELVKQFPAIGIGAFGFLLTFLGIIIQGSSETILWMKSRKVLYDRFITFNKGVILMALYLTVLSLILGFIDISSIIHKFNITSCVVSNIMRLLVSLLFGCFTKFIYDSINLVKIFFVLIRK